VSVGPRSVRVLKKYSKPVNPNAFISRSASSRVLLELTLQAVRGAEQMRVIC